MSDGPIKAEREARRVPPASTPNSTRVCIGTPPDFRPYCGRKNPKVAIKVELTTCADCIAALRADGVIR